MTDTISNGVSRRKIPVKKAPDYRVICRIVSRQQSTLYEEFGGLAAGPLAKLDAEVFAYVAFQCADHEWTALSAPRAARAMTKKLKRPVTEKQARDALGRLRGRGVLLVERRRFQGHGTNWYRPEFEFLVFVSALEGPVKGGCRAGEGRTRSRNALRPTEDPPNPPQAGGSNQNPVERRPNSRVWGTNPRAVEEAEYEKYLKAAQASNHKMHREINAEIDAFVAAHPEVDPREAHSTLLGPLYRQKKKLPEYARYYRD